MIKTQLKLLCIPIAILLLGVTITGKVAHNLTVSSYYPVLILAVIYILAQEILLRYRPMADQYLLSLVIFLTSISSIMLLRLNQDAFLHQIMWIAISLIICIIVVFCTDKLLELLAYPYLLGITALAIICLVMLFGTNINGNCNWIIMGPIQVQPSEFAKILIVAFLAAFLAENKNILLLPNRSWKFFHLPPFRFLAPLLLIWSISILMFVVLRDLGSALLFFGIVVIMTYVATGKKTYVVLAGAFFGVSSYISYLLFAHVKVRVEIWLHPWADPMGKAYQIVQSLFAFSYGGIWGSGYDHGFPKLIPAVTTDFIFAAIGEEFGLVGVTLLLIVYLLLFARGIKIALACANDKYKLLAFGLAMTMILQTFIILAGVTKLLPLTGITLPFISYGGSSMVASFISLGLLLGLSGKER